MYRFFGALFFISMLTVSGCGDHRSRRYIVLPTKHTVEKTQVEKMTTVSVVDSITVNVEIDWDELRRQLVCQTECDSYCCNWYNQCPKHKKSYCNDCWHLHKNCSKRKHDA